MFVASSYVVEKTYIPFISRLLLVVYIHAYYTFTVAMHGAGSFGSCFLCPV